MTEEPKKESKDEPKIYGLRTTANREDQVMDFVGSNAEKKKHKVFSIIRPHGMRGYIFVEAASRQDAEQAAFNIPYARGILPKEIDYSEIEHMLEMVKVEMNIMKSDIVEIISGPFKREQAKVTRIDKVKEEVVVELLEAAVPIPITVKMDAVKVIRRETEEGEEPEEEESVAIPTPETKGSPIKFADEESDELPMPDTKSESEATEEEPPKPIIPSGIKIRKKGKKKEKKEEIEEGPDVDEEDIKLDLDEAKESIAEKAKDVVEDIKEKVEDVVEDVKEAAGEAVEKVEEVLHIKKPSKEKKVKEIKEKVEELKEEIKEKKEEPEEIKLEKKEKKKVEKKEKEVPKEIEIAKGESTEESE
ncbi:transcription elongation factor Spt5 [Candidatus Woesearchaeota archaeon]|nr:transcription elongation factor Spt5 [Candidatus Woesearchaeota archaeon]